ncbi:hypothetical protein [Selenomonas ruminantium]|uniref:hypothetical protein n=1 Tax=Selenomonas ruminantium TaxID=971 RepID=UPI00047E6524|nr:hypothetical protein [Selenomonas ruminantium]
MKIIATLMMALAMLVGAQCRMEAADFYLGNYMDGTTAYLMTESIKESVYDRDEGGERYDCWVKIVNPKEVDYETTHYTITYFQVLSMERDGKNLYYLRNQKEFFDNNPVERNLVSYINRHYRDPYGKSR